MRVERRHYIPQFILKQFKDCALYELDKEAKTCAPRSIERAGQYPDFYPPHIEREVMERWDTLAARVCRYKVFGTRCVHLNAEEKRTLSGWAALFFVRCPLNFQQMTAHVEAVAADVEGMMRLISVNALDILARLREKSPAAYTQAITLLGRPCGHQFLLHQVADQIRRNPRLFVPGNREAFFQHIETFSRNVEISSAGEPLTGGIDFAGFINGMAWTWLHCPSGLVIGDNALCRWHVPSGTPNYGISRHNVEVTLPITKELCLLMRHSDSGAADGENAVCSEERSDELNRRQIASAVTKVYGPSCRLLGAQDEYGFSLEW
jgi:hypothetical protein